MSTAASTPTRRPVVVAIAGRPNSGKSTLFNRLLRRRKSIVHDMPGVTRDEIRARVEHDGTVYELIDTGGIEEKQARDGIGARVEQRTLKVLSGADVVLYLLDGRAGLSPADGGVARRLRSLGLPVLYVVNKVDHDRQESRLVDFAELGADELVAVSAAHGRGIDELWERVAQAAGAPAEEAVTLEEDPSTMEEAPELPPRIALIGRPNVGKSSLLNALVGFERALVDSEPGTTRDAIDVEIEWRKRRFVVVDTAGLRRPSRIVGDLETYAAKASLNALGRAEVAILVLDATLGVSDQDLRLADLAWRRGRGLVIAVNKIDLAPKLAAEQCHEQIARLLPQWPPLPLVRVSAQEAKGLEDLWRAISVVVKGYRRKIATPELNDLLQDAVETQPPPLAFARPVKLRYATQTQSAPQEVTIFANRDITLPEAYLRYVVHALREGLGLIGVPLRLRVRTSTRRRRDDDAGDADERGLAAARRSR